MNTFSSFSYPSFQPCSSSFRSSFCGSDSGLAKAVPLNLLIQYMSKAKTMEEGVYLWVNGVYILWQALELTGAGAFKLSSVGGDNGQGANHFGSSLLFRTYLNGWFGLDSPAAGAGEYPALRNDAPAHTSPLTSESLPCINQLSFLPL